MRKLNDANFITAILFMVLTVACGSIGSAQNNRVPISKEEALRLLRGDVTPRRVAELARERGIEFQITPSTQEELRAAGADNDLIRFLHTLAPKSTLQTAAQRPLDQVEILGLLVSTESSAYLARLVRQRGIDFEPSDKFISELKDAGAETVLTDALRSAHKLRSPISKRTLALRAKIIQHIYQGSQFEQPHTYRAGLVVTDWPAAEKEYRAALALNDRNPVLHIDLGHILLTEQQLPQAQTEFQKAVALRPKSPVAHCDLGYVYFLEKRIDDGIAEQRRAIQSQPSYADAHGHLAGDLLSKGDWDGAVAEYRKAIEVQPDLNSWRLDFASALLNKGDKQAALAEYVEAVQIKPDDPLIHVNIASALAAKRDWDDAIEHYRAAISLLDSTAGAPHPPQYVLGVWPSQQGGQPTMQFGSLLGYAHRQLGFALSWKNDWDGEIAEQRQAVALNSNDAFAYEGLGLALGIKGDWKGEVDAEQKATSLNPNDEVAHRQLGFALSWKNDWDGEIAEERQAIALNTKDELAYQGLGVALGIKQDWAGEIEAERKAIALNPNDEVAHRQLGFALGWQNDWDGEINEEGRAVVLNRNDELAYQGLGIALGIKQDWAGEIDAERQAVALNSNDALAHNELGAALEKSGDRGGALQEYYKASSLAVGNAVFRENYFRLSLAYQPAASAASGMTSKKKKHHHKKKKAKLGMLTGVVSDSMCGSKHSRPSRVAQECVSKCVSVGAQYVLVDHGRIYQVRPQNEFAGFAGMAVKVKGTFHGDLVNAISIALLRR